jgi:hypothetical protein
VKVNINFFILSLILRFLESSFVKFLGFCDVPLVFNLTRELATNKLLSLGAKLFGKFKRREPIL